MAACLLCRRVRRLHYLPGLRKDFTQARDLGVKQLDETDDQGGKKGELHQQEASLQGEYKLFYKPSSYHHVVWNPRTSWGHMDHDEEESFSKLTPTLWQQSNHYNVSCSRYLSSSSNAHLDLILKEDQKPKMPSVPPYPREIIPEDVKVDARAFQKCRPQYGSMTLDNTKRPQPIEWEEALPLLQKVNVLNFSMKPSDVCQFLSKLSRLHPDKISLVWNDEHFSMFLRYFVEHFHLFTLLQLLEVLQSFVLLDVSYTHTVLELYEAELTSRVDQMSLHQLLLAADLWRLIGRRVPQFLGHLYDSVQQNRGHVGVPELVQLLYIMGEGRQCPTDLIHPVEQLLMRHLDQLYPEEVGTVCLGLFKSQMSLSEGAVTCIVNKACSFVEEMSDFAMVNVLKLLRFSHQYHTAWLEAMALEVPRRAHQMGIKGLMHVALACSALHCHSDAILKAIAERVPSLVPHCRSKDSCKLLWAFGTLRFPPLQSPSFYPSLLESLRQKKGDFQQYPEHLLTGLLGLAFVNCFPEDLIAFALSPEFVELALKYVRLDLKKDLFTLDGVVALELPQWTGPRLSSELREEVMEMLWKFAQSDLCCKPEVQEAESALGHLLGGKTFVCKRMILPHTRSIDLEVHFDSTGRPIPLKPASDTVTKSPENTSFQCPPHKGWTRMNMGVTITDNLLSQLTNPKNTTEPSTPSPTVKPTSFHKVQPDKGWSLSTMGLELTKEIKEALIRPSSLHSASEDSEGIVKLAIQVWNRNQFCYHSQHLLGLYAMKRRQLKLAGYRVVELPYQEWFPMLRKSRTQKLAYLHCKIYNSLG